MSAPDRSTDPRAHHWPIVGDSLPDSTEEPPTGPWTDSRSHSRRAGRVRPGWHAYRPAAGLVLPSWAVEVTLTIEQPVGRPSSQHSPRPQALLLLRSASAIDVMRMAITDAMAEVEEIAGVGRTEPGLHLARSVPESGLEPFAPPAVLRHLGRASQRGLAAQPRRRSSASRASTWEAGAGAVLTCRGPAGTSAQAVVALHGRGDPSALQPPAGGALLVRAWRHRHTGRGRLNPRPSTVAPAGMARDPRATWALVSGLIIASTNACGLGRAACRLSASIRAGSWEATVLRGRAALEVARAGDPRQPGPRVAARWATDDEVTVMLASCVLAGMPT
jgi:hypothetical protein